MEKALQSAKQKQKEDLINLFLTDSHEKKGFDALEKDARTLMTILCFT